MIIRAWTNVGSVKMPSSSESHRVETDLFQLVFIKILINKEKRSAVRRQRQKYSAYSQWDCCTDFSFRCMVTTICAVSFLLSLKCVFLCDKNAWFMSDSSETTKVIIIKLGTVTASDLRMHLLIILTFIQVHTDLIINVQIFQKRFKQCPSRLL